MTNESFFVKSCHRKSLNSLQYWRRLMAYIGIRRQAWFALLAMNTFKINVIKAWICENHYDGWKNRLTACSNSSNFKKLSKKLKSIWILIFSNSRDFEFRSNSMKIHKWQTYAVEKKSRASICDLTWLLLHFTSNQDLLFRIPKKIFHQKLQFVKLLMGDSM